MSDDTQVVLEEDQDLEYVPYHASVNLDDGNIRFWADHRLDQEEYEELTKKYGFRWVRPEQCFLSAWSPQREDYILQKYGIDELWIDETDLVQVAEDRAEHYGTWSKNAMKSSEAAAKASNAAVEHIPFGQPILVGHHSERRHRNAIKKAQRNATKSWQERDRSNKWTDRASATVSRAKRRYTAHALKNRITGIEADIRRHEKNLSDMDTYEKLVLKAGENESIAYACNVSMDPENRALWRDRHNRWLEFLNARLEVAQGLYEQTDKMPVDRDDKPKLEKGGGIFIEKPGYYTGCNRMPAGWYQIHQVNKNTVTINDTNGVYGSGILGKLDMNLSLLCQVKSAAEWLEEFGPRPPYEHVGEVMTKEEWKEVGNDYRAIDGNGQKRILRRGGLIAVIVK